MKQNTEAAGAPDPSFALDSKYEAVLKKPEVRLLIQQFARQSSASISAEEFLKLADFAFKPVAGVSLVQITQIVVPIAQKLGIQTGKSSTHSFAMPATEVIVKLLCSLAKNGYALQTVEKGSNGLVLLAKLSSDFWTFGGDILITLEDQDSNTLVSIDVKIKGQLYDWGKSKSVIDKITGDINNISIK